MSPLLTTRNTTHIFTMRAQNIIDTLKLALETSRCDHVYVLCKPRLLSDNGPRYIAGELVEYLADKKHESCSKRPDAVANLGQELALAPYPQKARPVRKILSTGRPGGPN